MGALLLTAVALPAAGAAIAALLGRRLDASALVARATAVALAAAVTLAILMVAGMQASAIAWRTTDGDLLLGLRVDRALVLLLLLVLGVSWTVQRFARRSLHGDARSARFAMLSGLLTSSAAATAAAASLVGLALAWTLTSVALCALIALYAGWAAADEGARRTATALLVGDLTLWIGVGLLLTSGASNDLSRLAATLPSSDTVLLASALLLVIAASARSAQVPFHGWLPATLASPTPVSAMLHAGVVNAGAVLLLAVAPLLQAAPAAAWLLVGIGALTAVVGSALMLARPDVKGALAQSTVAQMGFMMLACGLGAWAAALLHLAAHGAYKASRFLGSGSAVAQISGRPTHHRTPTVVECATAAVLAGAPMIVVAIAIGAHGTPAALLGFAWGALLLAGLGWLRANPGRRGLVRFAAFAAVAGPAYVVIVEGAAALLAPALPPVDAASAAGPWILAATAVLLASLPLAQAAAPAAIRDRLYVWALTVGDGSRPPRSRRGRPAPTLVVDPEGSAS